MLLQDIHSFFLLSLYPLLKSQLNALGFDLGLAVHILQCVAFGGDLKTLVKRRSIGPLDDVVSLLLHFFFVLSLLGNILEMDCVDEAVRESHITAYRLRLDWSLLSLCFSQ